MKNRQIFIINLILLCLSGFPLFSMEASKSTHSITQDFIEFSCPTCSKKFIAPSSNFLDKIHGKKIKCERCNTFFSKKLNNPKDKSKVASILLCQNCHKPDINNNFNYCAKCQKITYCCRLCQLSNWGTHKLICSKICNDQLDSYETESANSVEKDEHSILDFSQYKSMKDLLFSIGRAITNIDAVDKNKVTILMRACSLGEFEAAEVII